MRAHRKASRPTRPRALQPTVAHHARPGRGGGLVYGVRCAVRCSCKSRCCCADQPGWSATMCSLNSALVSNSSPHNSHIKSSSSPPSCRTVTGKTEVGVRVKAYSGIVGPRGARTDAVLPTRRCVFPFEHLLALTSTPTPTPTYVSRYTQEHTARRHAAAPVAPARPHTPGRPRAPRFRAPPPYAGRVPR